MIIPLISMLQIHRSASAVPSALPYHRCAPVPPLHMPRAPVIILQAQATSYSGTPGGGTYPPAPEGTAA